MKKTLRFIDLFAGIGGIRRGFTNAGFECVYSNEKDKSAASTYIANYGDRIDVRDIRQVQIKDIPDHDILCAGFPCQPFSKAGVSARVSLSRKHGFEDKDQGALFFEIIRILKAKRPFAYFLENVSNFEKHDGGRTLAIVKQNLLKLGYSFSYKVIDASLKVPQRRKRIYMVGMLKGAYNFPVIKQNHYSLKDLLERRPSDKYTISDRLWLSHQQRTERNRSKGNGFRHHIVDMNGIANTLTSRYGKDGRENLILQRGKNPRMLTPRECARLMGFSETFILPDAKTVAYRQLGNSVCVPVIESLATSLKKQLYSYLFLSQPLKKPDSGFSIVPMRTPLSKYLFINSHEVSGNKVHE